jgi:probable phosphomutase (TIGR03848 family)
VATVLLIRHGRTSANSAGTLAGRAPGVHLDDVGWDQAKAAAERISALPLVALVSSPLVRCRETAAEIRARQPEPVELRADKRLVECGYGDWTGAQLKRLAKEPLWRAVQHHASSVTFPDGEAMRDMQARAVSAVRDWDASVQERHGPDAVWAAVSHGDVIKAVVADALGLHLDQFQRIVVEPASVCAITYTPLRPFVVRLNDVGGDLTSLRPPKRRRRRSRSSDAEVGGGVGPGPPAVRGGRS